MSLADVAASCCFLGLVPAPDDEEVVDAVFKLLS
jgi:hypothetical protein